jgi:calcineurin-like phosphoesterase family protein
MKRIWVLSDTHFGHENMYRFTHTVEGITRRVREAFADAREGDAEMVRRWAAQVATTDIVYHLGDLTMERSARGRTLLTSILPFLPGHKRLILGNHDHLDVRDYRALGFEKVLSSRRFGSQVLLSHIPVHPMALHGALVNVHGHTHALPDYGPQYRNVSVERINYTPILLDTVLGTEVRE